MRVLIFGGTGMLGHKLAQHLSADFEVFTTLRGKLESVARYGIFYRNTAIEDVDAADHASIIHALETSRPEVVINAAGVIKQLSDTNNAVQTLTVNSVFPQRLADLSSGYGFRLITISTDCVFSGEKGNYTESDIPDAQDLYGISKLLGEVKGDNCLTLRTSIIGRELATRHSLVEWFLSNREKTVKGYVNAIYSGFPTIVLAEIISAIIADQPYLQGIYHVSSDRISKFELLELLSRYFEADVKIEPSREYVIDRSLDSSAFRSKTSFSPPSWGEMIAQMAADMTPYGKWKT